MTRTIRFTRRAEQSLISIAQWTVDMFGISQATLYETELMDRCQKLANGTAHSRDCSVLVSDATDLKYSRAGEHFLVFTETAETVVIIDVLHSRSDLPTHIAKLNSGGAEQ